MNLPAAAALALPASAAYLAPALAAAVRRHPRLLAVLTVNLLLGWTLLGWAAALTMTLHTPAPPASATGQAAAPPPPSGPARTGCPAALTARVGCR